MGVLFIVSQINIAQIIKPLGWADFFYLQITFSDQLFLLQMQKWKESGLLIFFDKHFVFDFFHPLFYMLFFVLFIQWELLKLDRVKNVLFLFPVIAGLSDLIENIFHYLFLQNFSFINETTVFISSLFSSIKWLFSLASVSIILMLFLQIQFKKR